MVGLSALFTSVVAWKPIGTFSKIIKKKLNKNEILVVLTYKVNKYDQNESTLSLKSLGDNRNKIQSRLNFRASFHTYILLRILGRSRLRSDYDS